MRVTWHKRKVVSDGWWGKEGCSHRAVDRTCIVPIVVETVVRDGRRRNREVWRPGPTIRSCCQRDPASLRWWWDAVEERFVEMVEDEDRPWSQRRALWRRRYSILEKLAQRVPSFDGTWWHLAGERIFIEDCDPFWLGRGRVPIPRFEDFDSAYARYLKQLEGEHSARWKALEEQMPERRSLEGPTLQVVSA